MKSILVDVGEIPFKAKEHQKKYPTNITIVTQGTTRSNASTTGMQRSRELVLAQPTVLCCFEVLADEERPAAKKGNGEPRKGTNPFLLFHIQPIMLAV